MAEAGQVVNRSGDPFKPNSLRDYRSALERHIIPNITSLLIIDATIGVGAAVLAETGLSFFGFGIRSPEVSLGTVLSEGQRMATTFPWVFYGASGFLVWMIVSVNFIGDGLRDALDPRLARRL